MAIDQPAGPDLGLNLYRKISHPRPILSVYPVLAGVNLTFSA